MGGGPIAVLKREKKLTMGHESEGEEPKLFIEMK